MYRYARVEVAAANDSTLTVPIFGPVRAFFDQTKDLQQYAQVHRVNATDPEFTVPVSSLITNSYFVAIFSDYPVLLRFVGVSTAQVQLRSNNVAASNFGSPPPPQCVHLSTAGLVNQYLTLTPIAGAVQTANVTVMVSGDPLSAYL